MGQIFTSGSIARLGAVDTYVGNELVEVRVFGKKVLGWWIRGENMETFPEDPFETVKARIVDGHERQWSGSGGGGGVRVLENTEQLFVNERGWIPMGSEGSSEV